MSVYKQNIPTEYNIILSGSQSYLLTTIKTRIASSLSKASSHESSFLFVSSSIALINIACIFSSRSCTSHWISPQGFLVQVWHHRQRLSFLSTSWNGQSRSIEINRHHNRKKHRQPSCHRCVSLKAMLGRVLGLCGMGSAYQYVRPRLKPEWSVDKRSNNQHCKLQHTYPGELFSCAMPYTMHLLPGHRDNWPELTLCQSCWHCVSKAAYSGILSETGDQCQPRVNQICRPCAPPPPKYTIVLHHAWILLLHKYLWHLSLTSLYFHFC